MPKKISEKETIGNILLYLLFAVTKTDDHVKVYDDVPNSAVELQVKDKVSTLNILKINSSKD